MSLRFYGMIIPFILVICSALIVLNGTFTDVSLGDESHHFRFAQNIYNTGKRAPFDPLYESGNPPGFFNHDPPLWHFALAFLWKITGGVSQPVAQIFHVLFFILLVWCTSLLAKEMIGEERRWFPALIIATVPMVVSFSTLFYMDVPMAALSTLSFYMILRKRYISAGVASGWMYFTKLNGAFFLPGFLFIIFWNERKKIWSLLKSLSFFTIPILMIYIPDFHWRRINITDKISITEWSQVSNRLFILFSGVRLKEYLNSYLTNPFDLVKYLGLALLFLILLHLLRFRAWERKSAFLWPPLIIYLIFYFVLFGVCSDIRYLIPILPFLSVLITPSFSSLGKMWRIIIIGVCILQFTSTSYYVYQRRQIPPEVMEGFGYIRKNVSPNALILYPEENLLIYGQRKVIWSAVKVFRTGPEFSLKTIFWANSSEEMNYSLRINEIDHILIKKSRIYDDREVHHLGGYPKSFVDKLPHLDGWVKIFENSGVSLWKKTPT